MFLILQSARKKMFYYKRKDRWTLTNHLYIIELVFQTLNLDERPKNLWVQGHHRVKNPELLKIESKLHTLKNARWMSSGGIDSNRKCYLKFTFMRLADGKVFGETPLMKDRKGHWPFSGCSSHALFPTLSWQKVTTCSGFSVLFVF